MKRGKKYMRGSDVKMKKGLVGYLCFGKEGLEKKDMRKNQFRIPIIISDKVSEEKTMVYIKNGK